MGELLKRTSLLIFTCLMLVSALVWLPEVATHARAGAPKLTAQAIIAKHLEALAPAAVRAAATSRSAEGTVNYVFKMGGAGMNQGTAALVSAGPKTNLTMQLYLSDYPGERIVFDGTKFDAAYLEPGVRSRLGNLLMQENEILREGLLGGVLSTAWPLLDLPARRAKLKFDGLKKIEGVPLYRVSYWPKKTNNALEIYLFFDPETFRHVKTIYHLEIQPGQQNVSYTHRPNTRYLPDTRYTLEEDFSDFRVFDGFSLPTRWKIRYLREGAYDTGVTGLEWEIRVSRVAQNGVVAAKTFAIP